MKWDVISGCDTCSLSYLSYSQPPSLPWEWNKLTWKCYSIYNSSLFTLQTHHSHFATAGCSRCTLNFSGSILLCEFHTWLMWARANFLWGAELRLCWVLTGVVSIYVKTTYKSELWQSRNRCVISVSMRNSLVDLRKKRTIFCEPSLRIIAWEDHLRKLWELFRRLEVKAQLYKFFVCFAFWLHCTTCRILVPWQGIEPVPPAVEAQSLNPGPPGKSQVFWDREVYIKWRIIDSLHDPDLSIVIVSHVTHYKTKKERCHLRSCLGGAGKMLLSMVELVFLPMGRFGQCIMQIHNA